MRPLFTALAALALSPTLAWAAPPTGFDARADAVRKMVGAPGLSVAIVEGGKTTLARGYGVRSLNGDQKVDADTLFQIGSTSKAFTAAALATLVDEGKIRWDDPVIDHLPDFRMYDPWVTREMTIRDLLVHRSGLGLGQGDLMMVPATNLSRAETVRRVRYLKPATSFRSGYAYDNILYIVAGQLIEQVTGKTWEDYVRDRLFKPAGMPLSVTNDVDRFKAANRAIPHGRLGEIRGAGDQQVLDEKQVALGANSAPAGAIASNANELAKWVAVQLASGQLPDSDKRLFSARSAREMWTGVVPLPGGALPGPLADASPQFRTYALGWQVQDYRGHKVIQHGGATLGFKATVVVIPEKNVGFAIMTNSEESAAVAGLQNELLDHYLGLPKRDWPAAYKAFIDERTTKAAAAVRGAGEARPKTSGPARPAAVYAGVYADPWYGRAEIKEAGGVLTMDFRQTPGMVGKLEPWAYDTFTVKFPDPTTEPAFVTFGFGPDGKPDRITLKPVSPVADFSYDYQDLLFTPVASK